jgi:hypothetical protein
MLSTKIIMAKRYNQQELNLLLKEFKAQSPLAEIVKKHNRPASGIVAKISISIKNKPIYLESSNC